MKIAAYIRVSTDEQAQEGYSIPAQRNRLEAYAISQGWEIVRWYVDEGESAKDLNRTQLMQLLKDIKLNIFDCVLVYRLDRLTRSVLDLYKLLENFEKNNVKFKSATEVYDTTTAIGRLFITLVAALAQWERENLGERVRMGMQQKAKEGKWTVSIPPLGYDSNDSVLIINQQEAAIVKEIFSLYLSGMGMWKVARSLNERGLYSKQGKLWGQATISYVLKNPIYKGTMRYNYRVNQENYFETDEAAPAIVSEEDFNMAQILIDKRNSNHPREVGSKFIFSKVLKCARCGKTLIGKSSSTKRGDKKYYSYNYGCPGRLSNQCDLPAINEPYFEKKFIEEMNKLDFYETAAELEKEEQKLSTDEINTTLDELKIELKNINARRSKWQYAWVNEMISDEDFTKRSNEENEKEKMILKELDKLKPKESPTYSINIAETWSDLKLHWNEMTKEQKKQFTMITLKSIVVDRTSTDKSPDSISIKEVKFN